MGRKAQVLVRTGWTYKIRTDIPQSAGVNVGPKFDDYCFAFYLENKEGELVYLYQPLCSGTKSIDLDIESLKRNKKPAVSEIFAEVDIVDEETGEVWAELQDADLFAILEGIKEVIRDYKAD